MPEASEELCSDCGSSDVTAAGWCADCVTTPSPTVNPPPIAAPGRSDVPRQAWGPMTSAAKPGPTMNPGVPLPVPASVSPADNGSKLPGDPRTLLLIRRIGAAVLAGLAVIIFFTMGSSEARPASFGDQIRQALADNRANSSSTDNVYQQQVVNGWVARDLLTIVARGGDSMSQGYGDDDRIAAELVLVMLAAGLHMLTTPKSRGGTVDT
jgi:hypothetical protein